MPIPRPERYVLYGGELSYFTRKLEAALILYGADFEFRGKQRTYEKNLKCGRVLIKCQCCTLQKTG